MASESEIPSPKKYLLSATPRKVAGCADRWCRFQSGRQADLHFFYCRLTATAARYPRKPASSCC